MARRDPDGLWTQQLYGSARSASSARRTVWSESCTRCLQVESEWSESLRREAAEILAREAIVEDGLATWPAAAAGRSLPRSGSGSAFSGATVRLDGRHRGAVPRRGAPARRAPS